MSAPVNRVTATPSTPSRIETACARPESPGLTRSTLAGVAGHGHARAFADAGQHHLHLQARGVLRLVDDDVGVGQGAAAHEGDRRDLDLAALAAAAQRFGAEDGGHRLPDRRHVGVDLLVEVAGQEAEPFARFHGRPCDDEAFDLARSQQTGAVRRRRGRSFRCRRDPARTPGRGRRGLRDSGPGRRSSALWPRAGHRLREAARRRS